VDAAPDLLAALDLIVGLLLHPMDAGVGRLVALLDFADDEGPGRTAVVAANLHASS
jgi:hypothetical protein